MNRDKKGVSPIIAVLLLIVIAVAAAIVLYSYVMGFIGTTGTGTEIAQVRIVVDEANITKWDSSVVVIAWVRNVGTLAVNITAIYLVDVNGTVVYASGIMDGARQLSAGSVAKVTSYTTSNMPSTHRRYVVKVVTAEGAVAVSTPIRFSG